MNSWNCHNNMTSNIMYNGRVLDLSPKKSDCHFSSPSKNQGDLLDARVYSREDSFSACSSSVSDTSELDCQTQTDTMVYGGITYAAPASSTSLLASSQAIHSQQLFIPFLMQPETQQDKVSSHPFYRQQNIYQAAHTTDVSYALHPTRSYYISPAMSIESAFLSSFGYPYTSSNVKTTFSGTASTPVFNSQIEQQTDPTSATKRVKYEQQEPRFSPPKQANKYHHLTKANHGSSSSHIFPCTEPNCNKVFTRPYNLKSHMRTHTHERPYSCHYKPCNWKFARPHDLKRHELQHSGLKPHNCNLCHRSFARSDALKRHWKVDAVCSQDLQQGLLKGGQESFNASKRKRSSQ